LYVIPPSYLVGELLSDKALSTVWRMNKQVAEVHQGSPEFVYIFAEIVKTPTKIKN
jgi:hypothetical protein